jgi:UDP-2,3-diacylglucosamine pyrophosphatase LpxH
VDQYFREAIFASPFMGKQDRGDQRGTRNGCRPSPGGERYRTVFVSDVHLGTGGCKAGALATFLASTPCDTLFLVGDIIDGWRLRRRWYWPDAHTAVLHEILRKVDGGTRVVYVPGNHDEAFRDFCGRSLAGIEIAREAVHETADGKCLLVVHGDQFDV